MHPIEKEEELLAINGGVSFGSGILNALASGARILLELGRSLGSSIRRSMTGNTC